MILDHISKCSMDNRMWCGLRKSRKSDKQMTYNNLKILINSGREIEFLFEGRKYSITYDILNEEDVISFCEFYQ